MLRARGVRRLPVSPDVEVRLFIKSDFDQPPTLFYEIQKGRRIVVPTTYLAPAPDREKPLDVRTATSPDNSLVAVWSPDEFTIVYHRPSGESWPRLLDDETSRQPGVQAKWRARFGVIREIPLPPTSVNSGWGLTPTGVNGERILQVRIRDLVAVAEHQPCNGCEISRGDTTSRTAAVSA